MTSAGRTSAQQARAIRNNLRRHGVRYVLAVYRRSPAIREIIQAYRLNRRRPQVALREMTRVIDGQLARGVFISRHMKGNSVDIRSRGRNGARLPILRQAARMVGGKVWAERDHFHFDLV